MRRVSVVGNSGSGKTALARALAGRLGAPYVELDPIFHLPGWIELPAAQFRSRVSDATARPAWVVDGNYSAVPLASASSDLHAGRLVTPSPAAPAGTPAPSSEHAARSRAGRPTSHVVVTAVFVPVS